MSPFETPGSLDNTEIGILQKESKKLSSDMESRLKDTQKYKLFVQECTEYLERSSNEESKKRIESMFRGVLSNIGIDLDNAEDALQTIEEFDENEKNENDVKQRPAPSPGTAGPENENEQKHEQKQNETPPPKEKTLLDHIVPNVPSNVESTNRPIKLTKPIDINNILDGAMGNIRKYKGKFDMGKLAMLGGNKFTTENIKNNTTGGLYENGIGMMIVLGGTGLIDQIIDSTSRIYKKTNITFPVVTNENRDNPEIKNK